MSRLLLGKIGESYALDFLKNKGYKIIFRNYRSRFGEIDIIAKDADIICFIEVKTRRSYKYGSPQEAVIRSKQRRLARVALSFLQDNKLLDKQVRFDVISVVYYDRDSRPKLELIKDAFEI